MKKTLNPSIHYTSTLPQYDLFIIATILVIEIHIGQYLITGQTQVKPSVGERLVTSYTFGLPPPKLWRNTKYFVLYTDRKTHRW